MADPTYDIANLPFRMTTTEVAALARVSRETLGRRIKSGRYDLKSVDKGREKLFSRADVVRALGLGEPVPAPPPPSWDGPVDGEAVRRARSKRRKAAPPVHVEPLSDRMHRATILGLRSGIKVFHEIESDEFTVTFQPGANHRGTGWPAHILLPQARPGPVSLHTDEELQALMDEADRLWLACQAARARI